LRSTILFVGLATLLVASTAEAKQRPTEALRDLRTSYQTRFNTAAVYWAVAGTLGAIGVVTVALSVPGREESGGRFGLVSGLATTLSGVSSASSALPLSLAPGALEERLARTGGAALTDDTLAASVLRDHAEWARGQRVTGMVLTTVFLAANAILLGGHAILFDYQRVTAGVVAGLYAIGVPAMLWFNSFPSMEETVALVLEQLMLRPPRSPVVTPAARYRSWRLDVAATWQRQYRREI